MSPIPVSFYFGLGSRYSYLAATQLDGLEGRTGCRFEWLPLQSGALIRRANEGRSPFEGEARSGQYDWSYRQSDAEAWADYYSVPYLEPAAFRVDPADLAKACWAAESEGKLEAMSKRIFRAVFVEGHVVSRDLLGELAAEIGLAGSELVCALDSPEVVARHEAALARALEDRAFGVPSFVLGGRLFWGNDRLVLLERALARRSRA